MCIGKQKPRYGNISIPLDCKGNILEKSEGVLSLLEQYAGELSDPGTSLADIEPVVNRIKEEMILIEAEASGQDFRDGELGGLIRELAITANVAVFKFHRGDYI